MRRLRVAALVGLILLPSVYLAWRYRDMAHLGTFGEDDGLYIVAAKSLASGHGYRILSLPGEPRQQKSPILYPLVLSLFWRIAPDFPSNARWIMVASWCFLPVFLVLTRLLGEDCGLSGWRTWLLCAVVGLNPIALLLSLTPMAEMMFGCLVIACLMLTARAAREPEGLGFAAAAGLTGAAAYLTRTVGIALLPAGVVFFLFRRQYRRSFVFLAAMLPAVLAWAWWAHGAASAAQDYSLGFYVDYAGVLKTNMTWATAPHILLTNLSYLIQAIGGITLMLPDNSALLRPVGLLIVLCYVIWWQRSGITPYNLFAAIYCMVLLVWPYPPNERFFVPLLPILLSAILALPFPRGGTLFAAGALALVCLSGVGGPRFLDTYLSAQRRTGQDIEQACGWIQRTLPESARFISAYDAIIYLRTGRQGIGYRFPATLSYMGDTAGERLALQRLREYAMEHRMDYVLSSPAAVVSTVNGPENPIAMEVVRSYFQPVFTTGSITIFRRHRP